MPRKRTKLSGSGENKFAKVLSEFKAGTLKSSSGGSVKKRTQALAIAFSEGRRVSSHKRKSR